MGAIENRSCGVSHRDYFAWRKKMRYFRATEMIFPRLALLFRWNLKAY
jgi:hypothetical protein